MESPNHSWTQWLKRSYSETPIEGPDAKRVKFSDVHDSLMAQFPSELISKQMASHAIQEAFPNTQKQRSGREKNTYIVGIQSPVQIHPSNPVDVLQAQNQQLTERVHQLEARIHELEEQTSQSTSLVRQEILPSMTGTHPDTTSKIMQQMDTLLQNGCQIIHGPDTPDHFPEFTMDAVIGEVQSIAPDVYQFFAQLGNTDRNKSDDEISVEERKVIMSLCTVLNARSRFANGLQLLLSIMLIARATSKQVRNACKQRTHKHAKIVASFPPLPLQTFYIQYHTAETFER